MPQLLPPSLILIVAAILATAGCATAPTAVPGRLIAADQALESTRTRTQSTRQRLLDRVAIAAARSVQIEAPTFAAGADASLNPRERQVLLAGLGRKLCTQTADYFEVRPIGKPADLVIRGEITGVGITNRGGAVASLVGGAVSPVPFTPRLPMGLGGLSANVVVNLPNNGPTVMALRWAQGANAFTTDATPSRIGDAYELTEQLAGDVRSLLRDQGRSGKRKRIERSLRMASRRECEIAFGRIETGARLARFALPLTPELIEPKAD